MLYTMQESREHSTNAQNLKYLHQVSSLLEIISDLSETYEKSELTERIKRTCYALRQDVVNEINSTLPFLQNCSL